jgi:catechol 2,3-dioxygenase-like lactoylglutathione lyase family enzyme
MLAGKMVGFLITKDYEKAKAFYESKLGFEFVSLDQWALVMNANGTHIRIVRIENFTPAHYTVLGWEVQDIEAAVSWLAARGVEFHRYPFIQDQERGIWTAPDGDKVAWFPDPDGNVLSVSQHV